MAVSPIVAEAGEGTVSHSSSPRADCLGGGLIVPKADPGHGPSGHRSADSTQRSAPWHPAAWQRWLIQVRRGLTCASHDLLAGSPWVRVLVRARGSAVCVGSL